MHSTVSSTLFFQWCFKSTPVSLSSERFLQLLWESHRTEVVRLYFFIRCKRENSSPQIISDSWDLVAHPVTQVIGEQALVDILDLSEVAWTCWCVSTPSSGLGLRMVKELDLQLALGRNERR